MPISFWGAFWGDSLSYAESQKNKYGEILEKIGTQLDMTRNLDGQMEILRSDYCVMESNSDSADGKISTTYIDKEDINKQGMETLYSDLVTAIAEVQSQLSVVQNQYAYWCSEVEKERQRAREEEERAREEKRRKERQRLGLK